MYVTLDGPEATGKTTLLNLLVDELRKEGYSVLLTKEPGSTHSKLCQEWRNQLLNTTEAIDPITELMLFMVDRSHHMNSVIKPNVKHSIVLSDRSAISGYVYGISNGVPGKKITDALELISQIKPDISFVSHADFNWSMEKMTSRGTLDRVEQMGREFHKKIHKEFREIRHNKFLNWNVMALPETSVNDAKEIVKQMKEKILQAIKERGTDEQYKV